MSRKAYAWAFRQAVTPPARKFILVTLAHLSNDSGEANATIGEIVKATGVSRRVVINHINALIDDGLVKRQAQFRRDGSQAGNTFYLGFGNPFKHIREPEPQGMAEDWRVIIGDF